VDAGDVTGDDGYTNLPFIKGRFVYSSSPTSSISWIYDGAENRINETAH